MFEITVKVRIDGEEKVKPIRLKVDHTMTGSALKKTILAQAESDGTEVELTFNRKIEDQHTLGDHNVQPNSALTALLKSTTGQVNVYVHNPTLAFVLETLNGICDDLQSETFVFIGIGSYVQSDRPPVEIKQQQCPDSVVQACEEQGWNLLILLIDPGFLNPPGKYSQLYDLKGSRWVSKPIRTSHEDRVRYYMHESHHHSISKIQSSSASGLTWSIITMATGIPEYLNDLTNARQIGGFNIVDNFWNSMCRKSLKECCLATGNFYDMQGGQFCCIGDAEMLQLAKLRPHLS